MNKKKGMAETLEIRPTCILCKAVFWLNLFQTSQELLQQRKVAMKRRKVTDQIPSTPPLFWQNGDTSLTWAGSRQAS